MIVVSIAVLEFARTGIATTRFDVGNTPVTQYARAAADGPVVVIAHGFAGSQQMMQGYALPLAQAGYRVFVFEFFGHGRHRIPMSGDVASVDGTTRLLVRQTMDVMDAVGRDGPIALVGHSMATDILARIAQQRSDVGPVVVLSAFSTQINAATPENLLLVSGAWEPRLRAFALRAAQMINPVATEGQTVTTGTMQRRAVAAPFAEHVSILHSRAARTEAVAWIDAAYSRTSNIAILPTGWAIMGLLAGLVLVFRHVAGVVPVRAHPIIILTRPQLTRTQTAIVLLAPAVVAPLIAVPLNPQILPVLVADYLGLHLLIYGAVQLALLRYWGVRLGGVSWAMLAVLLIWCAVFGFALDRYAANFWPTAQRGWIIAIMALGALPFMVADAALVAQRGVLVRLSVRLCVLLSLGIAVALDFEGLFFLLLIAPILVLFFIVFGTAARAASARVGPLASGLALGVMLAWALGVSFPLFVA